MIKLIYLTAVLMEFYLISCSSKIENAKDEYYTKNPMFHGVFQQQFGLNEIKDGQIRVYIIPSFEKEAVFQIEKGKRMIKLTPRDSTIWSHLQMVNRDEKGEIVSGRVGQEKDSIPLMKLDSTIFNDSISQQIFNTLLRLDITRMKSIRKKGWLTMDGTSMGIEARINGARNYFEFNLNQPYIDKDYLLLEKLFNTIEMSNKNIQ
jgi:hypothetical protein